LKRNLLLGSIKRLLGTKQTLTAVVILCRAMQVRLMAKLSYVPPANISMRNSVVNIIRPSTLVR
jgi:hypothetical protein